MSVRRGVARLSTGLRELPVVVASLLVGAVLLGAIGGVVGLVIGLSVHPSTAWFAVLEVGVPAAAVGGFLGLVVGGIAQWVGGARGRDVPPVDDDFAGGPRGW